LKVLLFLTFRGSAALHRAARSGHIDMVLVLLQLGADVNAKDENDWYKIFRLVNMQSIIFICYNRIILFDTLNLYFYQGPHFMRQ